jgi:putative glutamine transport system substrate-binding protein
MGRWVRGSLVALTVLTLVVAGCAGRKTAVSEPAVAQPKSSAHKSWLLAAQYSGHVVFAARFGQSQGFQNEFAQRIVDIITDGKLKPEFEAVAQTRAEAFTSLRQGFADIVLDNWEPTDQTTSEFYSSQPFYADSLRVLVRTKTGVKKLEDLHGQHLVHAYEERFGDDPDLVPRYFTEKQPKLNVNVDAWATYKDAVTLSDIVAGPTTELAPFAKADSGWMLLPERLATWDYRLYVSKQKPDLAAVVDKAIQQLTESGELAQLVKKWGLDM